MHPHRGVYFLWDGGAPNAWVFPARGAGSWTRVRADTRTRFTLGFWATGAAACALGVAPGSSPAMQQQRSHHQHQPKMNFLTRLVGFVSPSETPEAILNLRVLGFDQSSVTML